LKKETPNNTNIYYLIMDESSLIPEINKLNIEPPRFDIVVFHNPCQDGITSAWVAHHYYKGQVELYPLGHKDVIDYERLSGKKVLFCDITPNQEALEILEKTTSSLVILDHHQFVEDFKKEYIIFDNTKSGATLTWNYFFQDVPVPEFITMIEDNDLWRLSNPNTQAFTTYLYDIGRQCRNFDIFQYFDKLLTQPEYTKECITEGEKILKVNKKRIAKACKTAKIIKWTHNEKQYTISVVESYMFKTEIGNDLCLDPNITFAVVYHFDNKAGKYKMSLRSNQSSEIDVAEIASLFGGNGHKHASGFYSQSSPFDLFS
jgi:oligoribonuclease NrnB/cAMP/cGMP phosphodiesterase (DHH superfamily)